MFRKHFILACIAVFMSPVFAASSSKPIEIDSPRGGEVYALGQQQTVVLGGKPVSKSVLIELSRDGGKTFETLGTINLASRTTMSTLPWTISLPATGNAVIRATSTDAKHPGSGLSGAFSIGMISLDQSTPDNRYVLKTGDSMSGPLTLSADPTSGLQAAPKQYVDSSGSAAAGVSAGAGNSLISALNSPATTATVNAAILSGTAAIGITGNALTATTANGVGTGAGNSLAAALNDPATTGTINPSVISQDPRYVLKAGDTMTGLLILSGDPTAGAGAATKQYVDSSTAALKFVDLTTNQTAAGNKTFTGTFNVSTCFTVEARPLSTGGLNNFIGMNAGAVNTTGLGNTFVGHNCGKANIGGSSNCFYGLNAGSSNTSGQLNVFVGQGAGAFNDSGSNNNCVGQAAGFNLFSGNADNFFGWHAGFSNSTGSNNTFIGDQAGKANSTASNNTFVGSGAGASNSAGTQQCFFGINAGNKTTASFNSFFGAGAGQFTTTGVGNTAIGNIAGSTNTTGTNNTFLGGNTGTNNTIESHNTFVGDTANGAAGNTNSTAVGANALVTASNSLVLGSVNGQNGAISDTFVGIGTTAPNSYLQVTGSLSLPIRTVPASVLASLGASDYVLVNTGGLATTIVLPQPGITGRIYVIKNRATLSATLGFASAGPTIDGAATLTIATNATAVVICDGTNWFKIN